ncbi:MAG TPA: NYN domain-containing protein [Clostridium sp.]
MIEEKRFAVLIDADNVSSKYIKYILDEISNYGVVTYKRIYGDWTKTNTTSWKEVLLENSISPIQQYGYTVGKNATDSAMIIDAMDILYSNYVEGFCIVSSDSDFTKLAVRLRESGMTVIGMGEAKTPKPFSVACNIFKYLDILSEDEEPDSAADNTNKSASNSGNNTNVLADQKSKEVKNMTDIKIIEESMIKIIIENGDEAKGIGIGELGSRLVKRYTDFDVRNYGYTKLSKFLIGFDSLDIRTESNSITVHLKTNDINVKTIEKTILQLIGDKGINMGELNKRLLEGYPDFNVRNYGYAKFSKLINDLSRLGVKTSGQNVSLDKGNSEKTSSKITSKNK